MQCAHWEAEIDSLEQIEQKNKRTRTKSFAFQLI